jgi:uroporphyrin-III C-methyltransferase/precorrin-2 dehydrogenase/sirohydrochlorin ferrochelatase
VFGATGDDTSDRAVSAAARAAGVPVNVVDRPELSDFIMPAVVDRGDVVIGISTNGASPILAQRVRAWIEDALPERLGHLARFARRFRSAVQGRVTAHAERHRFWERFFEGEGAELVLAGEEQRAARHIIRDLNGAAAERSATGSLITIELASHDADELTLRAVRALRKADVIAYDAALSPRILDYARRDAKRVALTGASDFFEERARGLRVVVLRSATRLGQNERATPVAAEAGRR